MFGSGNTPSNVFGGTSTSAFGSPAASLFTTQPAAPSTPSLFGSGQPQQQSTSLFGTSQQGGGFSSTVGNSSLFGPGTLASQPSASLHSSGILFSSTKPTQPTASLFNPTSQPTTSVQPSLFGTTPSASAASNLFNSFGPSSTQQQAPVLSAPTQPSSLFGNQPTSQAVGTSLFAQKPTGPLNFGVNQQNSTIGGNKSLFSPLSTSQPPKSLFGGPALSSLGPQPTSTSSLFSSSTSSLLHPQPSTLGPAAQPQSSIFGPPTSGTQLDVTGSQQRNAQRGLPLEQEVPATLVQLLEGCKNKLKENSELLAKLEMNKPVGAQKQAQTLQNVRLLLQHTQTNQTAAMTAAKQFMTKVQSDAHDIKVLAKIPADAKLRPGQANDVLSDLLVKTGDELQANIDILKGKVSNLETPLREYLSAKEGAKMSRNISKQELFDHIERTVGICDHLCMKVTAIHDQVETVLCSESSSWPKAGKNV